MEKLQLRMIHLLVFMTLVAISLPSIILHGPRIANSLYLAMFPEVTAPAPAAPPAATRLVTITNLIQLSPANRKLLKELSHPYKPPVVETNKPDEIRVMKIRNDA